MPPAIIDLKSTEDARDVVHQLVQALVEGRLVAFPTETVYGVAASALNEDAVERLVRVRGCGPEDRLTLAIKSDDDALDYVPDMSPLASRLARRCWPGPLTIQLPSGHPDSVIHRLPHRVQQRIVLDGYVSLRVPAHEIILNVMRLIPGPLALASANRIDQPAAKSADHVLDTIGDEIAVVVDDGPCQFGQPSSVVRVTGNRLDIIREGVLDQRSIKQLSSFFVLLVCTGNTCRSPMGEALLKHRLAEHLGCAIEELAEHGVVVASAGVAAIPGSQASPESIVAMRERGLDLANHMSQPITPRLVRHADVILTMTQGHRNAIIREWPSAAPRTHVISRDRRDVSDPIGGPQTLYTQCADQIDQYLSEWVETFPLLEKS